MADLRPFWQEVILRGIDKVSFKGLAALGILGAVVFGLVGPEDSQWVRDLVNELRPSVEIQQVPAE